MSKSLIAFLEKIHVPGDVITKLQAESDEIDIESISKTYLDSRNTYYESSLLKTKLDSEIDKTVKGMTLKSIKRINEMSGMGMTNTQMEEFIKTNASDPIEAFTLDAKKHLEKENSKLKSATNDDIIKELDKFKVLATERQRENEDLHSKWKAFEQSKEAELQERIRTFEAKQYWNKMVVEDKEIADVPGKSFALEAIEERIFSKYKVDKDGRIYNLDGSVATHPEKEVAVTSLSEIYPYFKEKAGLLKVSNAGEGGGYSKGPDGRIVPNGKVGPAEQAMIDQFAAIKK